MAEPTRHLPLPDGVRLEELDRAQRADLDLLVPPPDHEPLQERKIGRYFVRNLRRDEGSKALALYRMALEHEIPGDQWDWRFFARNPALVHLPAVFTEDGELAGLYPCTLRPTWVAGRELLSCQACATLTHPEHRGGGRVFLILTRFTHDRCWSLGVHFGFGGGANEAALKVGTKLIGYGRMYDLEVRDRRLSMGPFFRRKFGDALGKGLAKFADPFVGRDLGHRFGELEVEPVTEVGDEFDELWGRKRDRYTVLLRRDARELRWRWLQCPVPTRLLAARRQGVLEGYLALRYHVEEGVPVATVLDLFTGKDEPVVEALLRSAGAHAKAAGCAYFRMAPSPGSVAHGLLQREPWRKARKPIDYVIVRHLCDDAERVGLESEIETATTGSNWYYCQGDSDFGD